MHAKHLLLSSASYVIIIIKTNFYKKHKNKTPTRWQVTNKKEKEEYVL